MKDYLGLPGIAQGHYIKVSNHNMQIKIGLFLGSVPTKIGVPCNFYFIKFSPRQTVEAAGNSLPRNPVNYE